jgi:hypothetical protein
LSLTANVGADAAAAADSREESSVFEPRFDDLLPRRFFSFFSFFAFFFDPASPPPPAADVIATGRSTACRSSVAQSHTMAPCVKAPPLPLSPARRGATRNEPRGERATGPMRFLNRPSAGGSKAAPFAEQRATRPPSTRR